MSSRLRSSTRASTAASDFLADTEPKAKSESKARAALAKAPRGNELIRLKRIAIIAYITSLAIIAGLIYLTLNDILVLYPNSITKPEVLKGFNARFEYSVRYQTLLYLWLVVNIHSVIYVRLTKKALNPLVDSTEKYAQAAKNILTNSFEQILVSSIVQFGFVSFADSGLVMRLIPAINMVQLVGRIMFTLGYPSYRTFGMSLTLTPSTLMLGYNLYKFGSYLSFY